MRLPEFPVGWQANFHHFIQCEKVCMLIVFKEVLDVSTSINWLQFSQAPCLCVASIQG